MLDTHLLNDAVNLDFLPFVYSVKSMEQSPNRYADSRSHSQEFSGLCWHNEVHYGAEKKHNSGSYPELNKWIFFNVTHNVFSCFNTTTWSAPRSTQIFFLILLVKQQFVVTHTIRQTEIPALLGSWITNVHSVKILYPQTTAKLKSTDIKRWVSSIKSNYFVSPV